MDSHTLRTQRGSDVGRRLGNTDILIFYITCVCVFEDALEI